MAGAEDFPRFPTPFLDGETVSMARFEAEQKAEMMIPGPRTVLDRKLDEFTCAVREKSRWWEKVFEDEIVQHWKSEALQQGLTSQAFNFALQQLRHQAEQCGEDGIRPSAVPGVFESDEGLGEELRQELLAALQPLRDAPDDHKDWHPGSEHQVLDLVHPSLFPLVYGLSRRLTSEQPAPPDQQPAGPSQDASASAGTAIATATAAGRLSPLQPLHTSWKTQMGAGEVLPTDVAPPRSEFVSSKFQWLPAEVLVGADGRCVFDSYVNNMHPGRHAPLYAATSRLLQRMLPLLERTLATSAQLPQRVYIVPEESDEWWAPGSAAEMWEQLKASGEAAQLLKDLRVRDAELKRKTAARLAAKAAANGGDHGHVGVDGAAAGEGEPAQEDDEVSDESLLDLYWYRVEGLQQERRVWVGPTLPERFQPPPPPPRVDLRSRKLQVIVKYAEVVLTPERPEYGGGAWHVEGMENEAIVASCIAYLAADNISESRLHFRTMQADSGYEHNDDDELTHMYGMEEDDEMHETLGSVQCAQGRMLCWPNAFQHRVAPFRLADASRPGHRTIAVAFLVDPKARMLSTRDVPPQQLEWHDEASQLGSLVPPEVKRKLDTLREFPISLERAKELRLELMEERSKVIDSVNEQLYEREFSLCEH